jgi:drug/metabolite transporter (DMT)-like permease
MKKFSALFVVIAAILWGIDGIILRPSLYGLPVPFVVFIGCAIITITLSPILVKNFSIIKALPSRNLIAFLGVALFGEAIGTMAITKALFFVNYINLSVVILIQKLQPVFAILLASILLKEKLTKDFFIWGGLAIIGAYLMTFGYTLPNFSTGDKTRIAAIFAFIAAFSFGSSTVFSKIALKNVPFEVGTYLRFAFAAFILLIISLSTGDFNSFLQVTSTQWLVFALVALLTGGPAIFLYYYGLKKVSASVATICELAFPLTAVILEYFIHKNFLNAVQWLGAIVLFTGIIKVGSLSLNKK